MRRMGQRKGEEQSFGLALYQVIKQLKRERSSVFHCICSILDDAAFVAEVRGLYPDVPAVANLRCGLWYVSPPVDHTCYFKSTDGHVGQWAFSTVRLNLHVAHLAAQHGGALIVDATRNANKGGFPDALSRTIPIWAAVLNRAVARARRVEAAPAAGDAPAGAAACAPEGGGAGAAWDQGLHLPLWASRNEVQQVTARLDGWVDLLMSTHPQAVHDLAKVLRKPLRPLWISQQSHIWIDQVAQPCDLDFTPLVLVTASKPVVGERRLCPLSRRAQARAGQGQEEEQCDVEATSFVYQPGAGDDEESWAMGLTPGLLWAHQQELLDAGPARVHLVIRQLVQQQQQPGSRVLMTSSAHPPEAAPGTADQPWAQHNLPPLGCRGAGQPANVQHLGDGAYAIAGSPLVLGARDAWRAPAVQDAAVLFLGAGPPLTPTEQQQQQQQQQGQEQDSGAAWQELQVAGLQPGELPLQPELPEAARCRRRCWVRAAADKREPRSLLHALPLVTAWARHHLDRGDKLLIHDDQGTGLCVAAALAVMLTCCGDGRVGQQHVAFKEDIRRALARLADSYPSARPSRSLLKQVHAFLVDVRGPARGGS